jgi:hypothetical protein
MKTIYGLMMGLFNFSKGGGSRDASHIFASARLRMPFGLTL